jgi:hypothetical protein
MIDVADNGFELVGGNIIATPTSGGTQINGFINRNDYTYYLTNLAPDTEYEISIQLEYHKPNNRRIVKTPIYTFNAKTEEETNGIFYA